MRKSFASSLVFVVILAVAIPTLAAPDTRAGGSRVTARDRSVPALTRVIRLVKRVLGVGTTADPTVPIPGSTT